MKTVEIITLGCRVNQYESCVIAQNLRKNGVNVNKGGVSDYYIVNTCAVTAESERKSRQLVRRCAQKGKVIVIGCASQLKTDYINIDNVIHVSGNKNKLSAVSAVLNDDHTCEKYLDSSSMDDAEYECMNLYDGADLFSECRAFVKIQDGCNGKCTYCIIPKCRGSVRSRSAEDIITEAENLVKAGYSEIILTGIEVSAYNKMPLQELISELSEIEGLSRIRLGSLSPNIISERFLASLASINKFMPHFHLSLQSCSDKILGLMKRPYTKDKIFEKICLIRSYFPNCILSADIIVGFPNETEEDFIETMEALRELNIFHVHSFPYSEREGTSAACMSGSVDKKIRSERNNRLIHTLSDNKKAILDGYIGKKLSVLVEKTSFGKCIGHSKEFLEVSFPCEDCKVGDIKDVTVLSYDSDILLGIN